MMRPSRAWVAAMFLGAMALSANPFRMCGLYQRFRTTEAPPIPYQATATDIVGLAASPFMVPVLIVCLGDTVSSRWAVVAMPFAAAVDGAAAVVVETVLLPKDLYGQVRYRSDRRFWQEFEREGSKIPSVASLRRHESKFVHYCPKVQFDQLPDRIERAERLIDAGICCPWLAERNWLPADLQWRLYELGKADSAIACSLAANPSLSPDLVAQILADGKVEPLCGLACNPVLPEEDLDQLIRQAPPPVLGAIARWAKLSSARMRELAARGDQEANRYLAARPDLPDDLARTFAADPGVAPCLFGYRTRHGYPVQILQLAVASTAGQRVSLKERTSLLDGLHGQQSLTPDLIRTVWQETPYNAEWLAPLPQLPEDVMQEMVQAIVDRQDGLDSATVRALIPRLDLASLVRLRARIRQEMARKSPNCGGHCPELLHASTARIEQLEAAQHTDMPKP